MIHRKRDCKNPKKITFKLREDVKYVCANNHGQYYIDISGEHIDDPYVRNY